MEDKKQTFEIVAEFTEGNCNYIIRQPIKKSNPEELEEFYITLGNIAFKD